VNTLGMLILLEPRDKSYYYNLCFIIHIECFIKSYHLKHCSTSFSNILSDLIVLLVIGE